ncbi:MAG: ABC transporter ATP-binding protein [Halobacteriovoraceae bacterium]|nr:ABC transporter ATP-binding protein [Halobacteriovoraceae bacterium]MBC96911.1 ABC transporter ATP-binding protein [Halobacteriovoraceae bacterium]|tara:strand:- start:213810 stop:214562 length:753 start_codon:yes stop_codon:yes gene_type:complete
MLSFDNPAVRIDKLTKTFGKHTVLNELSFDIPRGKITTILGFSGAGKSTLLKHILGLMHPTGGKIEVLGKDLSELRPVELREFRQKFGMLFQYAALFDSLSALENVAFPLREFTKLDNSEIVSRCHKLLDSVGIKEITRDNLPSELSGGMRKRVGLARALALSPEIMLYDEPTTGLDPITTHMVNDLIVSTSEQSKDRQMTSIIISHDVRASLRISDFVAFLDRGNIVEYLPASEFANSKNELVQEFVNL